MSLLVFTPKMNMSSLFCLASLLWQSTQFCIFVLRVDLKWLWYSLTLKPCVVSAFWDQLPFCSINKHAWKSSTKHQIQQAVKTGCKQKAKQEMMRRIMHIKCCDTPVICNLHIIILQLLKTHEETCSTLKRNIVSAVFGNALEHCFQNWEEKDAGSHDQRCFFFFF